MTRIGMMAAFVRARLVLIVLAVLIAGVGQVKAGGNLIVNGGFETGDFTGWAVTHNGSTMVEADGFVYGGMTYHSHTGNYFAALGSNNILDTLSQTLTTDAGQSYTISLWLASDGRTANEFKVIWDGTTLSDQTNIPAQGYVEQTYTVQGTGSDTFTVAAGDVPGYLSLDDVSVIAASVPEPTSLTLLALGAASLAGYCWRRRRMSRA